MSIFHFRAAINHGARIKTSLILHYALPSHPSVVIRVHSHSFAVKITSGRSESLAGAFLRRFELPSSLFRRAMRDLMEDPPVPRLRRAGRLPYREAVATASLTPPLCTPHSSLFTSLSPSCSLCLLLFKFRGRSPAAPAARQEPRPTTLHSALCTLHSPLEILVDWTN